MTPNSHNVSLPVSTSLCVKHQQPCDNSNFTASQTTPLSSHTINELTSILIFWPTTLPCLDRGNVNDVNTECVSPKMLLGWTVRGSATELSILVVGQVSYGESDQLYRGLELVGILATGSAEIQSPSHSKVWIVCEPHSASNSRACQPLPLIKSISASHTVSQTSELASVAKQHSPCSVSLIQYSVPNARMLQYFSLEPLRLGPVSGLRVTKLGLLMLKDETLSKYVTALDAHYVISPLQAKLSSLILFDPLRWNELKLENSHLGSYLQGTAMRRSIALINQIQPLLISLTRPTLKQAKVTPTQTHPFTKESIAWDVFSPLTFILDLMHRFLALPIPVLSTLIGSEESNLKHFSSAAAQLDIRLLQLAVAPRLAARLRSIRKQAKLPTSEMAAPYIGLWNSLWLIANDVILGYAASILLVHHNQQLAAWLQIHYEKWLLDHVLWMLTWLGSWPAGLKLNTQLSMFFGDAYMSLIASWRLHFLDFILPRLDQVLLMIAAVGQVMGITMVIGLFQDLLRISTLHITAFHTLSLKSTRFFIYVLTALFDLFRGKKRNVLRGGRLDSATYELDQLLLGTILFTLVAFVFPTIYVYYLAFALIRLMVVTLEAAVFDTALGLLNHLPLFALMLKVKDPNRLPSGVWLQPVEPPSIPESNDKRRSFVQATYFILKSNPLSVYDIFEGYSHHVGGIMDIPKLIFQVLVAQPIRR